MKIYLKQDWDYQPSYKKNDQQGYFIGREKEKNQLVDEFLRKESGSILISGARGVGKTALVYKALQESTEKDEKIVPIVINSSQLELYTKNKDKDDNLPEVILKNLIRRLYGYFLAEPDHYISISENLKDKIGELYEKAIAKEFEITKKLSREETIKKLQDESIIDKLSYTLDKKYLVKVSSFVAGVIALFLPPLWNVKFLNYILAVILFLIPDFTFKKTKQWIAEFIATLNRSKSAEKIYKEDNSLSNLEYELNNILKELLRVGKKIIFVIDELDKIEKEKGGEEGPDIIFEVIKTYKNLFTLSSALFVFITSPITYQKIIEAKQDKGKYYTLFTNRIFLNRPEFLDLENFIESIIYKIEVDNQVIEKDFNKNLTENNLKTYKAFKNYLCYKSKSDYFDLYLTIRDYITSYGQENSKRLPIMDIKELGFNKKLQSKLQKALGQIFEINKIKEQSEWHKNDSILSRLYEFIENNYNDNFEFNFEQEDNIQIIIGDYFIPYLERLDIVQKIETKTKNEQGQSTNIGVYQWTGNIPGEEDIEDVPSSPSILFDEEKKFLDVSKKYIQQVNDINNTLEIINGEAEKREYTIEVGIAQERDGQEHTGINAYSIFEKYRPSLEGLQQDSPQHINKQDLQNYTQELIRETQKLKEVALQTFTNLTKKAFSQKSIEHTQQQLQEDAQLFEPIAGLRNKIIEQGLQHFVIYKNEPLKSKQLLITLNIKQELLSEDTLKLLEQNKSYRLVNIQTDDELNYSDKIEIVEEKIKYDKIKSKSGRTKRKRRIEKIRKKLTGFVNVKLEEDYTVFIGIIKDIIIWFE